MAMLNADRRNCRSWLTAPAAGKIMRYLCEPFRVHQLISIVLAHCLTGSTLRPGSAPSGFALLCFIHRGLTWSRPRA